MILCLSRVWKWKFLSWKAELDWDISSPSDDAWEGFSVVLSGFLLSPGQLQPFSSWVSWQSTWRGAATPCTGGRGEGEGQAFLGESMATACMVTACMATACMVMACIVMACTAGPTAGRTLSSWKCLGRGTTKSPGQLRQSLSKTLSPATGCIQSP